MGSLIPTFILQIYLCEIGKLCNIKSTYNSNTTICEGVFTTL